MKYSINWLNDFIDLKDHSAKEISQKLTTHSCEVEEVIAPVVFPEKVVVGKIIKISPHPDADRVRVCEVDVATGENLTICCGGSNIAEGQIVPVAMIGSVLPGDFRIAARAMRGVASDGMICAAEELGLPAEGDHRIWDMTAMDLADKLGQELREVLPEGDTVIDVENKSITNRPDLFSHLGIARELSTIFSEELKLPTSPDLKLGTSQIKVEIEDSKLCPRYTALHIRNVKIAPSPDWMKSRLEAVGLRAINNIVDVTNYVMFELGEPMHAFDARHLQNAKGEIEISVRKAKQGEKIKLLDETTRELTPENLVIANNKEALAIAGVMGGEHSGVADDTTEIVLEAANFDAVSIRHTQSALGIRTDSSIRFEKFLDPSLTETAILRAAELILEMCPEAEIVSELIDIDNSKTEEINISLTQAKIEQKIGVSIEPKQILTTLTDLGFGVEHEEDTYTIQVPTWRATRDITIAEDVIEEIARIYGYDQIPLSNPLIPLDRPRVNQERIFERKIKNFLAMSEGMAETFIYPFLDRAMLEKSLLTDAGTTRVENPLSVELELMQPAVLPNLLVQVERNLRSFEDFSLFTLDRVWLSGKESKILAGVLVGKHDFYELKGIVQNLLDLLGHSDHIQYQIAGKPLAYLHPGASADIFYDDIRLGSLGEVHPAVLKNFEIEKSVYYFEIDFATLYDLPRSTMTARDIPLYPEVKRDVSFLCDQKLEVGDLTSQLLALDTRIVRAEVFDIYQGDKLPEGKKSVALHIAYQDAEKTLAEKEAEAIHQQALDLLGKLGGEIRS